MKRALAEVRQLLSLKRNEEQATVLEAAVLALREKVSAIRGASGSGSHCDVGPRVLLAGPSPCEDTLSMGSSSDESTDSSQWSQYEEQPSLDAQLLPPSKLGQIEPILPVVEELSSSMGADLLAAPAMELSLLETEHLDFLTPCLHSRHIDDCVSMLIVDRRNVIVDCNSTFLQQAGLLDTTQLTSQVNMTCLFGATADFVLACLRQLREQGMGSMVIEAPLSLASGGPRWHQLTLTVLPGTKQPVTIAFDSTSLHPPALRPRVISGASLL